MAISMDSLQAEVVLRVRPRAVLAAPEQREVVRPGREVLQSLTELGGKRYRIRVFVDVDRRPAEAVTAYRTSRIGKYWRQDP